MKIKMLTTLFIVAASAMAPDNPSVDAKIVQLMAQPERRQDFVEQFVNPFPRSEQG